MIDLVSAGVLGRRRGRNRGLLFKYTAGDPLAALGAVISSPSSKTYVDANGIVQTAGAGVLRDGHYLGGVRSLLLEGQRTNSCLQSRAFTTGWTKECTVTAGSVTGPDGVVNSAATMTETATSIAQRAFQTFTASAGVPFSTSIFAKAGTQRYLRFGANGGSGGVGYYIVVVDLQTGLVTQTGSSNVTGTSVSVTALANGWYRVQTSMAVAAATAYSVIAGPYDNTVGVTDSNVYAGTSKTIFVDFTGAEVGSSFCSSPIATAGSAVTRSADSLSFPWAYVPQAGTFYGKLVELGSAQAPGNARIFEVANTSAASPQWTIFSTGGKYEHFRDGGGGAVTSLAAAVPSLNDVVELRGALNADGSVVLGQALNGNAEAIASTSAASALPAAWSAPTVLSLGGINGGFSGFAAFQMVKIALGPQSLATMRGL